MGRSIRVRLVVWAAVVQAAVLGGFTVLLYHEVKAARFAELDAQLESAASTLDVTLRRFPPFELNSDLPPPPRFDKGPPGKGPKGSGPPSRERLLADLTLPAGQATPPDQYFAVYRPDGSVVKSERLPADTPRPFGARPRAVIGNRGADRELVVLGPHRTMILVGRPTRQVWDELTRFAGLLAGGGGLALVVGVLGGWLISRRVFRPVAAIAATASRISADDLSARIDPARVEVELADLARVLNRTFDRLEAAFDRQARFTADASHELRTPLAVLRSQAELTLSRPRSPEDYQKALEACLRSAERMTDLVERLLALARADAGWPGLKREPVALDRVAADVLAEHEPLAAAKSVQTAADLRPAWVMGDPAALGQVVANLVANAVRYNRPGGSVRVQARAGPDGVTLTVADTGIGIPAADRPHIFERFYRVDKARSRAVGGTGLGLAICRAIIEAHGGRIELEPGVGEGATFRVTLPPAESPALPAADRPL